MTNVLIIDDNDDVRNVLRDTFEDLSCTVSEAADGLIAMGKINTQVFDLILTDIFMPNQDGIETIREIRRGDNNVCIVAMSGSQSLSDVDFLGMARRIGANFALPKPLDVQQITGILDQIKTA